MQPPSNSILENLHKFHPKIINLGLERIQRLLARLGHPEAKLPPVVHIAGTNGKGSTLACLRAMLEVSGRSVHVYTSPHLVNFAERIRLAGEIIDEDRLKKYLEECETINDGQPITFFEITTALAFLVFSRHPADFCLLETGMGGRLDATNLVEQPVLTLLSSISYDHQDFLGNNLAAIASEKAGILKKNVPCIASTMANDALAVVEKCAETLDVPLLLEGRDWSVVPTPNGFHLQSSYGQFDFPSPSLIGPHQIHNGGLAAMAALHLGISPLGIGNGLTNAVWPARLQKLTHIPLPLGWELWLDGGHNPGAGKMLAQHIAENWNDRPLDLIVGMINSKDSCGFLEPLAAWIREFRAISIPDQENTIPASVLHENARQAGLKSGEDAHDLMQAVLELTSRNAQPGRILICGSLYLAGKVLARAEIPPAPLFQRGGIVGVPSPKGENKGDANFSPFEKEGGRGDFSPQ